MNKKIILKEFKLMYLCYSFIFSQARAADMPAERVAPATQEIADLAEKYYLDYIDTRGYSFMPAEKQPILINQAKIATFEFIKNQNERRIEQLAHEFLRKYLTAYSYYKYSPIPTSLFKTAAKAITEAHEPLLAKLDALNHMSSQKSPTQNQIYQEAIRAQQECIRRLKAGFDLDACYDLIYLGPFA